MGTPPPGLRAARDRLADAHRRMRDLSGRIEPIAGGSATGVDRELAAALAAAARSVEQALHALHAVARDEN